MSETDALALRASDNEREALALVIDSEERYQAANAFGQALKALDKEIHASQDPVCDAAFKAHKAATKARDDLLAPVKRALDIVNRKQIEYHRAQEQRRAEERRKAEEEARRKAEEEAIRNAEALQAAGLSEAAEAALDAPVVVERVEIVETPKADGASYRTTYKAEVYDLVALCRHVVEHPECKGYVKADESALNAAARLYKDALAVGGVRVVKDTGIARRTA